MSHDIGAFLSGPIGYVSLLLYPKPALHPVEMHQCKTEK